MKIIISALFFILINFIGTFAQINQTSPCPTISVMGQSFIPKSGEPMDFTATISEEAKVYDIKYIWRISIGKILAGQGTSSIKTTWENSNYSFVVTLEIKGLPENCENYASEMVSYTPAPQPRKVFESFLDDRLFKVKNDALIDSLKADPYAQLFVLFYFKKNAAQKSIEQKIRRIENYLMDLNKIDNERVTKIIGVTEKQEYVQFWLVPVGLTPPMPENR